MASREQPGGDFHGFAAGGFGRGGPGGGRGADRGFAKPQVARRGSARELGPGPAREVRRSPSLCMDRSQLAMQAKGREYIKPRTFTTSPTSGGRGVARARPGRELYRPPGIEEGLTSLNPTAQEFSPLSPAPLTTSRSVDWGRERPPGEDRDPLDQLLHDNIFLAGARNSFRPVPTPLAPGLRKSQSLAGPGMGPGMAPGMGPGMGPGMSPGMGPGMGPSMGPGMGPGMATEVTRVDVSGLGPFPPEVEATVRRAMEDPNRLGGRALMELVRTIFTRVIEGQGAAESAARFCISIIEREQKETFLESLLNTCQEWYHGRGQLLRAAASPPGRWAAFMSFLNEMYGLLKRRQLQLLTKYEGVPPKLVLLSLLAECCIVTLTGGLTLASGSEVECLFRVLTHIGRDLEQEAPGQMSLLLSCLRDSFLHTTAGPSVRKTLLQLIELQAAGWQLPAPAVMYYYPGAKA